VLKVGGAVENEIVRLFNLIVIVKFFVRIATPG
jgi:hypothetical protein